MSIDIHFYNFLTGLTANPVEQNKVDVSLHQPYVTFFRANTEIQTNITGTLVLLTTTTYNVEVCGEDIDATNTLADSLKTSLNTYQGAFGGATALGVFVEEQTDEYTPKNMAIDQGFHVCSFQVIIMS